MAGVRNHNEIKAAFRQSGLADITAYETKPIAMMARRCDADAAVVCINSDVSRTAIHCGDVAGSASDFQNVAGIATNTGEQPLLDRIGSDDSMMQEKVRNCPSSHWRVIGILVYSDS